MYLILILLLNTCINFNYASTNFNYASTNFNYASNNLLNTNTNISILSNVNTNISVSTKLTNIDMSLNSIYPRNSDVSNLPVIIIHGILSSPDKLSYLKNKLENYEINVYLVNISKFNNPKIESITTNMNYQLNLLNKEINLIYKTINLIYNKTLINLIGLSQGGLLARGYVQWYPSNVNNLITINTPHGGIYFNLSFNSSFNFNLPFLSFSNYWRNPYDYNNYLKKSNYLARLNNEVNNLYFNISCNKLKNLNKFIMFWSANDEIISPPESGKFSTYLIDNINNKLIITNITNSIYYLPLFLNNINYSIYETTCSHYGLVDNNCIDQILPILYEYLINSSTKLI